MTIIVHREAAGGCGHWLTSLEPGIAAATGGSSSSSTLRAEVAEHVIASTLVVVFFINTGGSSWLSRHAKRAHKVHSN